MTSTFLAISIALAHYDIHREEWTGVGAPPWYTVLFKGCAMLLFYSKTTIRKEALFSCLSVRLYALSRLSPFCFMLKCASESVINQEYDLVLTGHSCSGQKRQNPMLHSITLLF